MADEKSKPEAEIGRVARSKERARTTYDRISRWYDLLEGVWEKRSRERARRKLDVKPGEKVLEIGFGPGHDLVSMAGSVGENGKAYGIDLSPRMLQIARQRIEDHGVAERTDLRLGDAVHLPFDAGLLDAVFISFTLELFDTPEIPLVLGECYRVLHAGGRIDVISLSKAGPESLMRDVYEWAHEHFPDLLDCRPIYVEEALRNAGFLIQDTLQISLMGLPVENVLARKPA